MTNLKLKATLVATTVALSLLASGAQAQAHKPAAVAATVGQIIADQGNAALVAIKADLAAKFLAATKPELPAMAKARVRKVSAPAPTPAPVKATSAGGSLAATAACAE